jgi:hypothetical protein
VRTSVIGPIRVISCVPDASHSVALLLLLLLLLLLALLADYVQEFDSGGEPHIQCSLQVTNPRIISNWVHVMLWMVNSHQRNTGYALLQALLLKLQHNSVSSSSGRISEQGCQQGLLVVCSSVSFAGKILLLTLHVPMLHVLLLSTTRCRCFLCCCYLLLCRGKMCGLLVQGVSLHQCCQQV